MAFGILLIRLVVGLTFAAHGAQKLFGWFGGGGLEGTGQFFSMLGFPGRRHALLAGLGESGGGLLLALGLFTPLAALALIAVMLVAVLTVHLPKGFFAQNGGYEYNLVLAVVAWALTFTGAGAFSLDAWLGLRDSGLLWGAGALVVGVIAGIVPLLGRRDSAAAPAGAAR